MAKIALMTIPESEQYGVEKRTRLITHMALDHNISVRLINKTLVSEQPGTITVYSNESDPELKKHSESIIKLKTKVPKDSQDLGAEVLAEAIAPHSSQP